MEWHSYPLRSWRDEDMHIIIYFSIGFQVTKKSESARMYHGLQTRGNVHRSTQLGSIPPFKPIPPADSSTPLKPVTTGYIVAVPINDTRILRNPGVVPIVPQFHGLPPSISRVHTPGMKAPQAFKNALQQATSNFQVQSCVSWKWKIQFFKFRLCSLLIIRLCRILVLVEKYITNPWFYHLRLALYKQANNHTFRYPLAIGMT